MSIVAKSTVKQRWSRVGRAVAGIRLASASIIVLALVGRNAEATCGDYVMVGVHHARHDEQQARSNADQSHSPVSHRAPPCNGPSCERRRSPPVAPQRANLEAEGPDVPTAAADLTRALGRELATIKDVQVVPANTSTQMIHVIVTRVNVSPAREPKALEPPTPPKAPASPPPLPRWMSTIKIKNRLTRNLS